MSLPQWVDDPSISEQERASRLIKYHLRRAALWHNPDASIVRLSTDMGMAPTTLHNGIARGGLSRQQALAVEAFCDGVVTRDQLAPKHFASLGA